MVWQTLTPIQTSQDWALTQPVTGSIFRINHNLNGSNTQSVRAVIAQAFNESDVNTYFDFRRVTYKLEIEGFVFIQPAGLLNRSLAIKRLDDLVDTWTIAIEVLDGMPTSISLPIEINEVRGLLEQLESRVTQLEFLNHLADINNPHEVTAEQVEADPAGTGALEAASAIAFHEAEADPHTQYAGHAEINQLQTAINDKETLGAAAAAIAFHKSEEDPHAQYATDANLALVQAAVTTKENQGVAAQVIAAHEATVNHPLVNGDLEAGSQGMMSSLDKAKLDTVAVGATANATDEELRVRSLHTGSQPVSTISGLGNAATRNVGTAAGTVAAGDDTRLSNSRTPTGGASGVLSGSYPSPSFAAGVFARSLGNPGWEKLHSGKVLEWGSTIVALNANGDGTISLPLALATFYTGKVNNGDSNVFPERAFITNTNACTTNTLAFSVRPNPGAVNVRVNWDVTGA